MKAAIESFSQPLHLIAGGLDKGGDFDSLNDILRTRVKCAYLIGEAGPVLNKKWKGIVETRLFENLSQAFSMAAGRAESGEVILLSPGCASFDQYKNFEVRGEHFKTLVHEL